MCWMCDREAALSRSDSSLVTVHVGEVGTTARYALPAYYETALPLDGVGDFLKPELPDQLVALPVPDDVPDSITGSNPSLTVDAAHTFSTINQFEDQDFYRVDLQAGVKYDIGMYAAVGGASGLPLADAYLELYDAAGNMVAFADGDAPTPSGQLYGLDAMITLTVNTGGTYYVNARAFDNTLEDGGDDGDVVGDYELFVQTNTEPDPVDNSYYAPSSPLRAIDWGTQVNKMHQSVRNPDGAEGPRPTGNPHEVPVNEFGITGKNVITYYFAKAGEIYVDSNPATPGTTNTIVAKGFEAWEEAAYLNAFAAFAKVADLAYVEVDGPDVYDELSMTTTTDFTLVTYLGTPGRGLPSLLGRMSPPDTDNEGQTEFNAGDERWNQAGLARGGFSFVTLIHELGHGHGLAHPHDEGGESSIMNGVQPAGVTVSEDPEVVIPDPIGVYPDYTHGEHDLNQGVYTMMSYQDGWETSPYGQASSRDGYGWLGGLSAFDIAVIQDKYGVNEEWATGNNTYTLKDVNAPGTFYECIWDAGGTADQIVYGGARDANIDLRAATLRYEPGGGGWISWAWGIHGGFTIANGVTIENARSGSGDDTLIGNGVANILDGGGGVDAMSGGGGNDIYYVDRAADTVTENADEGTDLVYSLASFTLGAHVDNLILTGSGNSTGIGNGDSNLIIGNSGRNRLDGGAGADLMKGRAGDDTYVVDHEGDRIEEAAGQGTDHVLASVSHTLANALENLTLTGTGHVDGTGNGSANLIIGNAGNNVLNGMGGADLMKGRDGDDTYYVDNAGDVADEAFNQGVDSVFASVSHVLDGDIENLTLTGAAAINGTGNGYANQLTGNAGANSLRGGGGADRIDGGNGNDSLYGGAGQDNLYGGSGADGFYFDAAPGAANADHINGYASTEDSIYLDDAVFAALGLGTLAAGAFVLGTAAGDADDRILYDQATGQLFYDRDGSGGAAALLFASVDAGTVLTSADFIAY